MTTITIDTIVARWSAPAARPLFKGRLIDEDGCCCAQGDVLRLCGWTDDRLRDTDQDTADLAVAGALGISTAHAVLLRIVNDRKNGCPEDVLAHPERVIGDQAPRVLAFWRRLNGMTPAGGEAARAAARAAAGEAAGEAAWAAAGATNEIQSVADLKKFYFLPMFGIADPAELDE